MKRSVRISVSVPLQQRAQLQQFVEGGEFRSTGAVIREALRAFLARRSLHAGALGATRLDRSVRALQEMPEPFERVELLFDAGDAKA